MEEFDLSVRCDSTRNVYKNLSKKPSPQLTSEQRPRFASRSVTASWQGSGRARWPLSWGSAPPSAAGSRRCRAPCTAPRWPRPRSTCRWRSSRSPRWSWWRTSRSCRPHAPGLVSVLLSCNNFTPKLTKHLPPFS